MKRHTSHSDWALQRELAREMRHAPTIAEDVLWQRLRNKQVRGLRFRRQHPIDRFIVDFYCVEAGLVIEIDGGVHQTRTEEDRLRQAFIESRGIRVIRFTNNDVLSHCDTVMAAVATFLRDDAQSDPPLHDVERGWPKAGGEVPRPAQLGEPHANTTAIS